MQFEIVEETPAVLPEYEKISIAFRVETFFRVELLDKGLSGFSLVEEAFAKPFIKDYDAYPEERPSNWTNRFDLSIWGILSAFDGERRIGGAAIAWKTPEVNMLDGREDLACLWDLRVDSNYRGIGVGKTLFARAVDWAKARNCRLFKVETQNINVPACRFYASQGCELGAVNLHAYPEPLNEIQLVWYRKL
jgi:GNAT superfamily N-acetyltransferase